ncbi:phosphoribosyl transferase domain protein [Colletotrichum sojae]|uniref:Phosphoribosyl transferase domain protein n=1 Tax=Colletotrichum sojae TaxID=2175907 RepID=A0A8H6MU86_9PEZI|nr:phosphoribosyl transferase domain protein [Colletotrichum sojae]
MTNLEALKHALRQHAASASSSPKQPLSDTQSSAGFYTLVQGSGGATYRDFIVPQLSRLLDPLFVSRAGVSVLEIGPGPKSVLVSLLSGLRRQIKKYTAFEPNGLYVGRLEQWLSNRFSETGLPLPCLDSSPDIRNAPFTLDGAAEGDGKFDVVLFCHSMYGMKPKRAYIERALELLDNQPKDGMVVVFHRDGALNLDGLVCHRTSSFPTRVVRVKNDDDALDCFARFLVGFSMHDESADEAVRLQWRKVCRSLGRREEDCLVFAAPDCMATFNRHSKSLPELAAPTEIQHVQACVKWAIKHGFGLTVLGGGHSGHCVLSNVVAVDVSAFDQVHVLTPGAEDDSSSEHDSLVVAEAGCKTGDIVHKAMEGGIGHLARLHGLTCDAIVGAVVVGVESGRVICLGRVPSKHRPAGAECPENGAELLWAIEGAGTNFGVVISVTFAAFPASLFAVRHWNLPLLDDSEARSKVAEFDWLVASKLPRNRSADAYLYWDNNQLHLGVTVLESTTENNVSLSLTVENAVLGREDSSKLVGSVGLFDTEMYVSGMHGGYGGGKTSAFKRCIFLKSIRSEKVSTALVAAFESRPTPLCYLHLLHGGKAVSEVPDDATAFGCRDWDFACVITGVWPREQDGTEAAGAAVRWVYRVAENLLPLGNGAYGADLGPDPRDAALADRAFGRNRPRLARLKRTADPHNVLAYACPLPKAPRLIVLVTGDSCAGKDYCAGVWASVFNECSDKHLTARVTSISDAIKREYTAATGADLDRLLHDRVYKVQQRPQLPIESFLDAVYGAGDVDMLLITGMRDEAPVAAMWPLVPDSRMLEVRVRSEAKTRRARGGCPSGEGDKTKTTTVNSRPDFVFDNNKVGAKASRTFAKEFLLPFFDDDLQRLANMVSAVPDFPRPGICFRHVLDISQQPGGLPLCTSLLTRHFTGDWAKVDAVACCEVGGIVFAAPLASQLGLPLTLIREAGKLPPPTVSVAKLPSHISSSACDGLAEKRIEMDPDLVYEGASVVVVDDVFATGMTVCAVLELLIEANVGVENISILTVAEFPIHKGRELLRQRGFGGVSIQSLMTFGGA